jgi:DNA-directed RNA polymerase subunit RPC12/RpoP
VIRLCCSQCGFESLQVSGEQAGKPVVCPSCGARSFFAPPASTAAENEAAQPSGRAREPLRGMSRRVRWAVVLVAGAGAVSLLASLSRFLPVPPGVDEAADWATPLASFFVVLLLACLSGHATGCPACGRWWSRAEVVGRSVGQKGVFVNGGVPLETFAWTTYQCGGCGHRWSVMDREEFREPAREPPARG